MISVSVVHRQGNFTLDAHFEAGSGVTALFGPSGSGKTTLVRMIAGLTQPREGRVVYADEVWNDTDKGVFVPPHRRRIGYVFQEGHLFPHMSVRQNLRYGRFFAPPAQKLLPEDEVIALLGIGHLLSSRPATLSGGEKQRVAIGRAMLSAPKLILMDEPLSALDRTRKQEILPYIERIRDSYAIPIVYVSHQIDEVARLSNQVVLMRDGRVSAFGTPAGVFADIAHLSDHLVPQAIVEATLIGHDRAHGLSVARIGTGTISLHPVDLPVGTAVRIRIPATDVILALEKPKRISALNQLEATITTLVSDGGNALVSMDCAGQTLHARVTLASIEALDLRPGLAVHALFKAATVDSASVFHSGSPDLSI